MYPSTISWTIGDVLQSIAICLWLEWKFNSNNYWSCSVDRAPSDEGLCKVLQEHPNWEEYAIPLGLNLDHVNYFYRQLRGDKGVLALRHWRDGHCGEDHPGTWRFLLKVIGDSIGPIPAEDLAKEVITNGNYTLPVG